MGRHKFGTREQMIGATVAIYDWATTGKPRDNIDWSQYDSFSAAQVMASVISMGQENIRVRNLHRDLRRKQNYAMLLDVVGKLDVYKTEGYYRKMWWQIRMNHLVSDTRKRFGVDIHTMAKMMGCNDKLVWNYENFHEFINDPALLYAFKATADIPVPKHDEWGRKFRRAMREYRAAVSGEPENRTIN